MVTGAVICFDGNNNEDMDTRRQSNQRSNKDRGQTDLGYVEKRLRKTNVKPTVSTDDWYTPRWIIDKLGPFDCDPCAPPMDVRPFDIAPISWTKEDDGLSKEWRGTVWMNPPYSRVLLRQFCERMAQHGDGIALLVNRQDNLLWQEVIFPTASSMIFMRHRVKFLRPDGTAGTPFFGSCLVAWGHDCDRRLRWSGIEGKYVVLNL